MNPIDFDKRVRKSIKADLGTSHPSSSDIDELIMDKAREFAVERWEELNDSKVSECAHLIKILHLCSAYNQEITDEEWKGINNESMNQIDPPRVKKDMKFKISYILFLGIKDETEELRRGYFKKTTPPFDHYVNAIEWLEDNSSKKDQSPQEKKQLREFIAQQAKKYRNRYGKVDLEFGSDELKYYSSEIGSGLPEQKSLFISPESPLIDLQNFLYEKAKQLNCSEMAIFLYFSLGIIPPLPKIQVELDDPPLRGFLPEWNIRIRSCHLNMEDLRKAYGLLQELRKKSGKNFRREEDLILLETVKNIANEEVASKDDLTPLDHVEKIEKDELPQDTVKEFWQEVFDACKRKGVDLWSGPEGAMMRFRTLIEGE